MRIAWLLALGMLGCDGSRIGRAERAITNGADDQGDPAVGALLGADGAPFCTGTLITPVAVLTAAHCLDDGPPAKVFFGQVPGGDGELVDVARAQQHPAYDPDTHANDVGIVLLTASPEIVPVNVYVAPFDHTFVNLTIRLVGFGLAGVQDDTGPRKRFGMSRIQTIADLQFSFVAAPSQTCFGDSGGPAFGHVGGAEYLLGITSTGDPACVAGGTDVRVGAFEAGFVQGYLSGASDGSVVAGGCQAAPGRARAPLGIFFVLGALLIFFQRRRYGNS